MDKNQCAICGTRRQRNLIKEYVTTKKAPTMAILKLAMGVSQEILEEEGFLVSRIICKRCKYLVDSGEIKYKNIAPDWIFGAPRYRYRDQKQINDVHHE